MYGYIYKTTNNLNGMIYIGKCKSSEFKSDYYGSGVYLNKAIQKYKQENFVVEIIDVSYDKLTQLELEKFWIKFFRDFYGKGRLYNIADGGEGFSGSHTEETKAKLRKANVGKTLSKDHKQKIRKTLFGHKVSKETRIKIGETLVGKHPSEETKVKMRMVNTREKNPMYGKHHSEETKVKMRKPHRSFSEETKAKMRKSQTGKHHSKESIQKRVETRRKNGTYKLSSESIKKQKITKGINKAIRELEKLDELYFPLY